MCLKLHTFVVKIQLTNAFLTNQSNKQQKTNMRRRRSTTKAMRRSSSAAQLPPPIATGKGLRSAAVNDELISEYLHDSLHIPYLQLPELSHSPPIATGKGSRLSAVDDELLSGYLRDSLQFPYLQLPESPSPASSSRQSFPAKIDYRSLVYRDGDSVNQLLRSASDFGVFLIGGHGIPAEELGLIAAKAQWLSEISGESRNREEIVWFRCQKQRSGWARDVTETQSMKMESVASKLDEIAKELGLVFSQYLNKRIQKEIVEMESVLSLHKTNLEDLIDLDPPLPTKNDFKLHDHALSLHLPIQRCEYYVQSGKRPLSFDAGPEAIVGVVRDQLEDWSQGEFKSVLGEFFFESGLHGNQPSFSLEFKCSPSSLNHGFNVQNKTISIRNQIQIALIITLLYNFFVFVYG